MDDSTADRVKQMPTRFVGAWRRESVCQGESPPVETHDVIWIQGERHFADIRISKESRRPHRIFGGWTEWDGTYATWTHKLDIDLDRRTIADRGRLSLVGDRLTETGSVVGPTQTGAQPVVEVYRRLSHENSTVRVLVARDSSNDFCGVLAQCELHRVAIVDRRPSGRGLAAGYWLTSGHAQRPLLSYGRPAHLPPPDASVEEIVGESSNVGGQTVEWQMTPLG